MNEALKEKAAQALSEILDLALQTKDFVVEQAPDVVRQLLAWNLALSLLQTAFTVLLIAGFAAFAIYLIKKTPICFDETETETFPSYAIGGGILALDFFISLISFSECEWIWLKILVAPKLFLIEYAAQLVR